MLAIVAALLFLPLLGLILVYVKPSHPDHNIVDQIQAAEPSGGDGEGAAFCLGGPEFMAALAKDLASARKRAVVQTLSFEGDEAGEALAEALIASPAVEKRLLIDSYSLLVQSDHLVGSPLRLFDLPLYREAGRMRKLVARLRRNGVQVVFGRPYGFGRDNFVARDHKKICVVDDASYLGGINFSDHNFQWRDMMLRLDDPRVADALAADFAKSWEGVSADTHTEFGEVEIVIGRGGGTSTIQDRIVESIGRAEKSIFLECPYITEPAFEMLAEARRRGVTVTIVTSERLNRTGLKWSIVDACVQHDFELRLWTKSMTHIKAMLVDGQELVIGSANFDFLSFTLQPEIMAVVRDPATIARFEKRIMEPSLAHARPWSSQGHSPLLGTVGRRIMGMARSVLTALHRRG